LLLHLLNEFDLFFDGIVPETKVKVGGLLRAKVYENLRFLFHIIYIDQNFLSKTAYGSCQCFLKRHFVSHEIIFKFINFLFEIFLEIMIVLGLALKIF